MEVYPVPWPRATEGVDLATTTPSASQSEITGESRRNSKIKTVAQSAFTTEISITKSLPLAPIFPKFERKIHPFE